MFWWGADSTGWWQSHLVPGPGPRGRHLSLHHYYKPPPNIWSFIDITFNSIIVLSLIILVRIEPPLCLRKRNFFSQISNVRCWMKGKYFLKTMFSFKTLNELFWPLCLLNMWMFSLKLKQIVIKIHLHWNIQLLLHLCKSNGELEKSGTCKSQ